MNNDLISRKALKEELKQYFTDGVLDGVSARLAFNQILHDIDNTPTVEPEVYMTGKDYNLYLEGYKQGRKDFGRPQGKWVEKQITPASCTYVCSKCGTEEVILSNFCRDCGADMRGKEGEQK